MAVAVKRTFIPACYNGRSSDWKPSIEKACTDMYQEYVAETVGVQKERYGEGKCYGGIIIEQESGRRA